MSIAKEKFVIFRKKFVVRLETQCNDFWIFFSVILEPRTRSMMQPVQPPEEKRLLAIVQFSI